MIESLRTSSSGVQVLTNYTTEYTKLLGGTSVPVLRATSDPTHFDLISGQDSHYITHYYNLDEHRLNTLP